MISKYFVRISDMKADLSYNYILATIYLFSCFHNCSNFREIRNYMTNGVKFEQTAFNSGENIKTTFLIPNTIILRILLRFLLMQATLTDVLKTCDFNSRVIYVFTVSSLLMAQDYWGPSITEGYGQRNCNHHEQWYSALELRYSLDPYQSLYVAINSSV